MKMIILVTDALVFLLLLGMVFWFFHFQKTNEWKLIGKHISDKPKYIIAVMVLMLYSLVGFLDSIHYKDPKNTFEIRSILDVLLAPRNEQTETTYSAPFALHAYSPEVVGEHTEKFQEYFQKLKFAGQHLEEISKTKAKDIYSRIAKGIGVGMLIMFSLYALSYVLLRNLKDNWFYHKIHNTFWTTLGVIVCSLTIISFLMFEYHILGTDKVGRDVFYMAIKSIRTGLVIGTVTTLVMLPFALLFGMWAGYFRGWVDDVIQYIYTTLSSIPGILLIAAAMLSLQGKIESNPDVRLLVLCVILGVTSWTTLCRLLRGESLKLREMDFVQGAVTLGTTHLKIIRRHIMPNLMHIVIISVVLDFSGLVLAEAVLSYVGIGVDPLSFSWGNMINSARLDMARDPIVWWSLCGALFLMFILVFSANILSDALQEALNPRKN